MGSVCHTHWLTCVHITPSSSTVVVISNRFLSPKDQDCGRQIFRFLPGNYCHTESRAAKALLIHGDLSRAAHYSVHISTAHTSNSSNFKTSCINTELMHSENWICPTELCCLGRLIFCLPLLLVMLSCPTRSWQYVPVQCHWHILSAILSGSWMNGLVIGHWLVPWAEESVPLSIIVCYSIYFCHLLFLPND